MYLLATPIGFLDIALFCIAFIALLLAIRFFIASRKKLKSLLPERPKKPMSFNIGIDRDGFLVPAGGKQQKITEKEKTAQEQTKQELKELRNMMQLQQLELDRALRQLEALKTTNEETSFVQDEFEDEYEDNTDDNAAEVEELQLKLYRSENKIKELQQQAELNQKLQINFEDMQSSYLKLQEELRQLKSQGRDAAEAEAKADGLEQVTEQLEATIREKDARLRELTEENKQLRQVLMQTEEKLTETNLHRQQLSKKISFVQELHTDLQQVSDVNRKLKTELRRVAELESMLTLITEERDVLMARKRV